MSSSLTMSRQFFALFAPLLLLGTSCDAARSPDRTDAKPAPREYMSGMYGLTFAVPPGLTYCPLPEDWIGSDHGTTLYLEPPRSCGGAGYSSSSRRYDPRDLARITLYYGYWMGDDAPPPQPCKRVGAIRFLGKARPVCETDEGGLIMRSVTARYMADNEAEAVLALVTRPGRDASDMADFAAVAASMRPCAATHHGRDGSQFTVGTGAPCPATAVWF
jgi:hypothetical protein